MFLIWFTLRLFSGALRIWGKKNLLIYTSIMISQKSWRISGYIRVPEQQLSGLFGGNIRKETRAPGEIPSITGQRFRQASKLQRESLWLLIGMLQCGSSLGLNSPSPLWLGSLLFRTIFPQQRRDLSTATYFQKPPGKHDQPMESILFSLLIVF